MFWLPFSLKGIRYISYAIYKHIFTVRMFNLDYFFYHSGRATSRDMACLDRGQQWLPVLAQVLNEFSSFINALLSKTRAKLADWPFFFMSLDESNSFLDCTQWGKKMHDLLFTAVAQVDEQSIGMHWSPTLWRWSRSLERKRMCVASQDLLSKRSLKMGGEVHAW